MPRVPARVGGGDAVADELRRRIVEEGESFRYVVHRPFLDRELSRAQVRRFVERAHAEAGGSYPAMTRQLGVDGGYRKLLHFLSNHDVGARR